MNSFAVTNLYKAPHKVCIVYDEKMQKHCDFSDNTHPEKPSRISSIYKNHEEYGLLERCYLLQVKPYIIIIYGQSRLILCNFM
jgi:histone deacetylase 6